MRPWRWIGLGFGLLAVGAGCGEGTPSEGPPHLVLLIADDLGWGDTGFTGGDLPTPRLDALARESLVLERLYAAPLCSPSRAQLLTGKDGVRLGMLRNVLPGDAGGLPAGEVTLADRLGEAGYDTALVGKWHLGHASPTQHPGARGFRRSYGHLRGWVDYTTHAIDGDRDWHRDGAALKEEGYATDLIAAEALRVIAAHDPGRPLFLVVSFNAPHAPLHAAPGTTPGTDPRAQYASMVGALDGAVGRVLDALDEHGLAQDTLLWFLSDNGANAKHGGSNAPLALGKYSCREGGLRVPALVRWPARIAAGRSAAFVGAVDVAPTAESLAGLAPRAGLDGVDLSAVLTAGAPVPGRSLVFGVDWARVERRALLRPPLKLVRETRGDEVTEQLFDVVADPREERNLAAEREEDRRALSLALDALLEGAARH